MSKSIDEILVFLNKRIKDTDENPLMRNSNKMYRESKNKLNHYLRRNNELTKKIEYYKRREI